MPREIRMLAELVAYLEREIGVRSQANLTNEDLELLLNAHRVVGQWEGLFELIEQQLAESPGSRDKTARLGPDGQVSPLGTGWDLRLNPPSGGWPALDAHRERNDGKAPTPELRWSVPSLLIAPSAPWTPTGDDAPAVGVGMTVGCTKGWPDGLREDEDLFRAARERGFTFGITGGNRGRIFHTGPRRLDDGANPRSPGGRHRFVAREVLEEFRTLGQ
jgi:hypothetical protein